MDPRDIDEILYEINETHKIHSHLYNYNMYPVTVDDVKGVSLGKALSAAADKWGPMDMRMYDAMAENRGGHVNLASTSGEFIAEQSMARPRCIRDSKPEEDGSRESTVEIGIYLNKNAEAFRKYNKLVEFANEHAVDLDRDEFGQEAHPRTTMHGGIVDPVASPSPHLPKFELLNEKKDHIPGVDEPGPSWALKAVLHLHVRVDTNPNKKPKLFKVSFKVIDKKGRKLVSGEFHGENLSEVTSAVYHTTFGSYHLGKEVAFFEGWCQLLAGYKGDANDPQIQALREAMPLPQEWASKVRGSHKFFNWLFGIGGLIALLGFWFDGYFMKSEFYITAGALTLGASILASIITPNQEAQMERAHINIIKKVFSDF